ncbi:hypothetical protein DB032_00020 [Chromobacterium sp. Panama]|uniref:DUF6396 domain-containing protein n=1 Tax=Chromobacterium sp. Panama TaxID=2161826 RepID=UPI000D30CFDA|nr:DUF6396 domain-containing protein [Chromobacterium sp. Panama]PTU63423.1 hypothetical protein DB032_00020 [Chromobacterium sp. Panama]
MFSHASTRQNPANRPLIQQAAVTLWLTALAVSIAAPALAQEPRMSTLSPKQQEALAFRCVHQQLPAPTPEADQLFLYARYLQKHNLVKRDPAVNHQVRLLYRIAAAHGHVKANINLQNGLTDGDLLGGSREVLALNQQLLEQAPAPGYYNLAYYTSLGYGIKRDRELALRYFRKAADLGNPEAQFYVAELLSPYDKAPDIAVKMWQCAAEQGHAKAASTLGIRQRNLKQYPLALQAHQLGVKAGDSTSALALGEGFKTSPPDDGAYYMALKLDPERSRRYQQIRQFLSSHSYLQPTVEDVDQIVPLPPAPLPPWDGGFRWLKAWRGPGPAQPSEALIQQLAEARGLAVTSYREPPPVAAKRPRKPSKANAPLLTTSAFRCIHQRLPEPMPEAEHLFLYARHLLQGAAQTLDPAVARQALRLYRIAAAHGHVQANINLQSHLLSGYLAINPARSGLREAMALNQQLVDQNLAPGYYNFASYNYARGGNRIRSKEMLQSDREQTLRAFRKAADLGSPEALFHVANVLTAAGEAPELTHQMYRCAAEQGLAQAVRIAGRHLRQARDYQAALQIFQLGVKAGDPAAAYFLRNSFNPPPYDSLFSMGLARDPERSRRYQKIEELLRANAQRQPEITNIDQIVPLPPAPLPPWDGSLQWQKAFSGPGPDQPSEELIQQLAEAKQLDPATGLFEAAPGTEPTEPPRF